MSGTRKLILTLHLYLGLVSAMFLVILGLTGSVMAFEGQIDHWLHPSQWYVTPQAQTLPESELFRIVEQRFAPARVGSVTIAPEPNIAQALVLAPPRGSGPAEPRSLREITIDQYTGSILSVQVPPTRTASTLAFIHQFHLRLVSGQTGKLVISLVGLVLVVEVPLGVVLWWRTKRASVKWKASGFRLSFDLHHIIGVYFAAFSCSRPSPAY